MEDKIIDLVAKLIDMEKDIKGILDGDTSALISYYVSKNGFFLTIINDKKRYEIIKDTDGEITCNRKGIIDGI